MEMSCSKNVSASAASLVKEAIIISTTYTNTYLQKVFILYNGLLLDMTLMDNLLGQNNCFIKERSTKKWFYTII